MNWYIAKIVFQIVSYGENPITQFDEQLRLVKAYTKEKAFEKAKQLGAEHEHELNVGLYNQVNWNFVAVADLNEIGPPEDGQELYFKIEESSDANNYIQNIKLREQHLLHRIAPIFAGELSFA